MTLMDLVNYGYLSEGYFSQSLFGYSPARGHKIPFTITLPISVHLWGSITHLMSFLMLPLLLLVCGAAL